MKQTISILGTGWYGLPLAQELVAEGYRVKGSTTTTDKISTLLNAGIEAHIIDLTGDMTIADQDFFNCDVLIVCIPPKRSSAEQDSYVTKINKIQQAAIGNVEKIIFLSSTSIYPELNDLSDESTAPKPNTPSGIAMLQAENVLREDPNFKTTAIRFAGLVGPGRNPGRFFAGKTNIPNGRAPINLIHLQDCIGLTKAIIQQDKFPELLNACSPDHPQKQVFYTRAAERSKLTLPDFVDESGPWKIIDHKKSTQTLNYKYVIDNWSEWLEQDID